MNICIIGFGSIGRTLARALDEVDEVHTIFIIEKKPAKVKKLEEELTKIRYSENYDDVLEDCRLVVETAAQGAVKEYIPQALERGVSALVMSVGAFVDDNLWDKTKILAKQNGCKIYIPSGAVCGIDGLGALGGIAVDEIEEVILMSYKSPKALKGQKYFIKNNIDISGLTRPKVVYDGWARDAVQHFPKNVNVAATVSLAGLGFDRTRVKIIVDPKAQRNTHRLIVKARSGEIECWTRNVPFPENPKTSYLAALSLISSVKRIIGSSWVGI
ncbi:MAG: aspartate dehydrogenase [Thermoplasmata archaeon]|nr:aspartate dehydrogenase [Thermoplasmata archaeon]